MMPKRRDETGVSNVLGAIMVFGLLVTTLFTIQVKFVPVWEREKEANLMQGLSNQFGQIKSDMDRMADNRTRVPITDPVTLGAEGGFRFFSNPTLPGSLSFTPSAAGTGFRMTAPYLRVLESSGQKVYAGSENWVEVVSGSSISDVAAVDHLRLRIANPASYSTGQATTFTILNATNAFKGSIAVVNIDHGATYSFEIRSYAASSQTTPVSIIQETFDKKDPPAYQYFDLLRDTFQFGDILAQAPQPFYINLQRNGMNSDYTLSYAVVAPGGGTVQVGSGGVVVPNYNQLLGGGSLRATSNNQYFPRQQYIAEYGGVIVSQSDGTAMRAPPQMTVQVVAGQTKVNWVLPALTGASAGISGPTQAAVTLNPATTRLDLVATAPRLSVTLATEQPLVWAQHFTTVMQSAGLSSSGATPQFSLSTTPSSVTVNVFGLQTDPNSTVDDIFLTLKAGSVPVRPHAGGSS